MSNQRQNAQFIVDYPERNPDLFYATRFSAPDPVIFFTHEGKSHLVLNNLELNRGKKIATVDNVLSINPYIEQARREFSQATQGDVLDLLFRERKIRRLETLTNAWVGLIDDLRKRGYEIALKPKPLFPERFIKSQGEKGYMHAAQRTVFRAMREAEKILRASRIRRGVLYYRGKVLTSEWMRAEISSFLFHQGFVTPEDLIIACDPYSVDPHARGTGPIKANKSIVIDITPCSAKTRYYGDATRTFCRGAATPELKRMYAVVRHGQEIGIKMIRAGVNGRTIHAAIMNYFTSEGFPTEMVDGAARGFIHSTGHGIGIEVHEEPQRIAACDFELKAGMVVSVEPGLYYPHIGGVRIEDLVYVTKSGCDILGGPYPKRLEL